MTDWKEGDRVFARLKIEKLMTSEQMVAARIISTFEVEGVWYAWLRTAVLPPKGFSPEPRKWIIGEWPLPVPVEKLGKRDVPIIPGLDDESGELVPA